MIIHDEKPAADISNPVTARRAGIAAISANRPVILLSLVAILVIAFWWRRSSRFAPQRLMSLESPVPISVLGVRDGRVYVSESGIRSYRLRSFDVLHPDRVSTLWESPRPSFDELRVEIDRRLAPSGVAIIRRFRPAPPVKYFTGGAAMGKAPARIVIREVSREEMGSATSEPTMRPDYEMTVRSFGSEPPRRVINGFSGRYAAVVGRRAYWIEDRHWTNIPKRFVWHLENDVEYAFRFPPCSRLMVSTGGAPSEPTGISLESLAGLTSGANGIYWVEGTGSYGSEVNQLHYLPASGSTSILLSRANCKPPVEHAGWVYWLESTPDNQLDNHYSENGKIYRLMRSRIGRTDGSRIATVEPREGNRRAVIDAELMGDDSGVYLRLEYVHAVGREAELVRVEDVMAVAPDKNPPLQKRIEQMTPPTASYGIDHGYWYYNVEESHENWLDWSRDGLVPNHVRALYRRKVSD